jgi:hypothetical protein
MHPLAVATVLALALSIGCTPAEPDAARDVLPPAIGTESVLFSHHEEHGFGPGGNETGFTVLALTDAAAGRVSGGGITWLDAQTGGRIKTGWAETPVPRDEFWMGRPDSAAGVYPDPTSRAVLDRYGFGIAVPAEHLAALDAALQAPGNYFVSGPGGVVAVLVPRTRRAYVFYSG